MSSVTERMKGKVGGCDECVQAHWHTVSKQSGIRLILIEPHPSAGGDMSSMNESFSANTSISMPSASDSL